MNRLKQILALGLAVAAAAVNANAVANGNFDRWTDGKPDGWTVGQGTYEPEPLFKRSGGGALRMKTAPDQKSLWLNNTLSQKITLKPNTRYTLSVDAAKTHTGTFRFSLCPLENGKKGKPAAEFNRWAWGFPYTYFNRDFTTGAAGEHLLEIIHYGNADGFCYLDSVKIREAALPEPAKKPGFYRLSSMYLFENDVPAAAEPLASLDFICCRNETESAAVLWKTDAPRNHMELRLKSVSGLPPQSVVIRDLLDSVLPLSKPRNLGSGETAAWQVFVKTTPEISPGDYKAMLELAENGRTVREIPMDIKVVDITLPPAQIPFLVYHSETYMPEPFLTPELREKYYRDLAEHGMNTITLYNNPQTGRDIDFGRNYSADPKLIPEKFRDRDEKNDPQGRYVREQWEKIFDFGLDAQMALAEKYGLVNRKYPILWLPVKAGNYGFGGIPAEPLKKALAEWRSRENWPEPLLYVMDEPNDMPERIDAALAVFANLKKNNIDVRTVTAYPDPDILGHLYDVWILSNYQVNFQNLEKALKLNREIMVYNCNVPNTNAAFFRALYGFWALHSRLSGVAAWAYYDARGNFTASPDGVPADKSASRLSRVGLTPDGPVPTAAWEATREGTEDYRLGQYFFELMRELDTKRQALLKEASGALSRKDMSTIARREADKFRKIDPKREPAAWEPGSEEQKAAEKIYLRHLELDNLYRQSKQALRLFNSIGSLAPQCRSIDEYTLRGWHPDLGENNAPDDAEVKRRLLLPYVLMLQEKLQ